MGTTAITLKKLLTDQR